MVEVLVIKSMERVAASQALRKTGITLLLALICGCRSVATPESTLSAIRQKNIPVQSPDEQVADFEDLALLTEALLLVKRYYVEDSNFTDLVYSAIGGMLQDLDPNSSFLPPASLKSLDDTTRGKFVGIGVNVESGDQGVKVIAPLQDSPALKAGIKAGDTITSVDGDSLRGLSLEDAVTKMRGESGTSVKVTVERADGAHEQVELLREDIKLSCIESYRMLQGEIGYVRLKQFTATTVDELEDSLRELVKAGARKLIFDLRDNPGGLLSAAVGVADLFLEKGSMIVTLKSRSGEESEHEYAAGGRGYKLRDLPMVIMVNGGSASASEVVAGALRDNGRATLVGQKSFGKASVQSVVKMSLRPECAVRLTTGYYYTPNGTLIHGQGIEPDHEVLLTLVNQRQIQRHYRQEAYRVRTPDEKAAEEPDDKQLEKAMELLSQREAG
ncbi:MAG: S41 family peptidase [Kiritimatiellae bacterium]|nr:S41 family peptidase [Kiritimatiellia bacterium]